MEVEESSQSPKQSQPWPIEATPLDRRFSALGGLRILPDEILCAILTYLSPRDVARVACVSRMDLPIESDILCQKPLRFDGFNSLFLYRRLYRCYTTLNGFAFDNGNVERSKNLSLEEFHDKYDGQKPVWCFVTD
nr:F-box protein At1g78280 isoform X1 [Ipomoea batatas]